MGDVNRKLVTIITEAVLENDLLGDLKQLGASGYTVTNSRGSGSRGVRKAGWSSDSNIRVEVVCSDELAGQIADHLREKYYDNFAMISFESDIRVLRSKKFL